MEEIMLVLTRRVGEKIIIADNIIITNLDICKDQIKIGFEAPNDISTRLPHFLIKIL